MKKTIMLLAALGAGIFSGNAQMKVTANPADNSVIDTAVGITAIAITVEGYSYGAQNQEGISMSITRDGSTFATVGATAVGKSMDNRSAYISLPSEAQMTEAGDYVVTMPEGYFRMTADGGSSSEYVNSPAITLNYKLSSPSDPLTWTITPSVGATVNEISTVTVRFNKAVKEASYPYGYLFYSKSLPVYTASGEARIALSDDGLTATMDFNPPMACGGIYEFRFFEGSENLSVVDGQSFPGINSPIIVDAPLETRCVPEEGSELINIEATKVRFPWNQSMSVTDKFKAYYTNGTTEVEAVFDKLVPYDMEYPSTLDVHPVQPIVETGSWTLVIEAGSMEISNFDLTMTSPEVRVNYTVAGGFTYAMTPAPGGYLRSLKAIDLDLGNAESVELDPEKEASLQLTYNFYGSQRVALEQPLAAELMEGSGAAATVRFSVADVEAFLAAIAELPERDYTYNIVVTSGLLTVNGYVWDGATFSYKGYAEAPEFSFDPASGSEHFELKAITVTTDATDVAAAADMLPVVMLGETVVTDAVVDGSNPWTVTFGTPLSEPGTYTVVLTGLFLQEVYGACSIDNPVYVIKEKPESLEMVTAPSKTSTTFYRLDGVKATDPTLPGVYIRVDETGARKITI